MANVFHNLSLKDVASIYVSDPENRDNYENLRTYIYLLEYPDLAEELINMEYDCEVEEIAEGIRLARRKIKQLMLGDYLKKKGER